MSFFERRRKGSGCTYEVVVDELEHEILDHEGVLPFGISPVVLPVVEPSRDLRIERVGDRDEDRVDRAA